MAEEPDLLERMVRIDNLRTAYEAAKNGEGKTQTYQDEIDAAAEYIEALEAECARVGIGWRP